jgi:hypothetical protein
MDGMEPVNSLAVDKISQPTPHRRACRDEIANRVLLFRFDLAELFAAQHRPRPPLVPSAMVSPPACAHAARRSRSQAEVPSSSVSAYCHGLVALGGGRRGEVGAQLFEDAELVGLGPEFGDAVVFDAEE